MVRARLWFRCAAVNDPITPILVQPAVIGWEAKYRSVGLTIERAFKGEELIRRMKGWITVNPLQVIEVIGKYGRLKVLDERDLVVELEDIESYDNLQKALDEVFGDQVDAELVQKSI